MRFSRLLPLAAFPLMLSTSCKPSPDVAAADVATPGGAGQAAVVDNTSPKSIARIASDSKDHTTLVAALKAVSWFDALANPGPLTVFAPVNAGFDKLPPGTVETLLKPENLPKLRTILLHHVLVSTYKPEDLVDGMVLPMLAGGTATVKRQGDDISVEGAKVIGTVPAGNGMVYVVDAVILPKESQ